ncbi:MAG: hypothetical protein R3E96_03100 [Planctomycetota bacterium]
MRITRLALAEREGDIPLLVEHFLRREERKGGPPRSVSPAVMQRLVARPWPGNVRGSC